MARLEWHFHRLSCLARLRSGFGLALAAGSTEAFWGCVGCCWVWRAGFWRRLWSTGTSIARVSSVAFDVMDWFRFSIRPLFPYQLLQVLRLAGLALLLLDRLAVDQARPSQASN